MVIVAGHLVVDPEERDDYLSGCVEVVRQARRTPGCLDFSLSRLRTFPLVPRFDTEVSQDVTLRP